MARTRKGTAPDSWKPFEPAFSTDPRVAELHRRTDTRLWKNHRYTVEVTPRDVTVGLSGWAYLSVKRNDRAAVRNWRDLQRIKNELLGPEREAVEIFPAESRLVDEANQYHLWVCPADTAYPIGFVDRRVGSVDAAAEVGARQAPWDTPPADIDAAPMAIEQRLVWPSP